MTIIGTDSAIAFAPQATRGALPALDSEFWRWLPALNMAFSPVQDQKALPQELSGVTLPRGIYKSGAWGVGSVDFFPRYSQYGHLHWLLWSLGTSLGASQVDPAAGTPAGNTKWTYYYGGGDTTYTAGAPSGGFTPNFTSGEWNSTGTGTGSASNRMNRYLAAKRLLPPDENGNYRGETLQDVRVAGLTLRGTPDQPLRASAALVGRIPRYYNSDAVMSAGSLLNKWNPSYALLADATPGPRSDIPGLPGNDVYLGCKGEIKLNTGTPLDVSMTDVAISIMPILTTPDDERIMFDYHPEGFSITGWAIGFTFVIKKGLYTLYDNIFFGGDATGAAEWSPVPWSNGSPVRLAFETASDSLILYNTTPNPDTYHPSKIEVFARDVSWSMSPIAPEPGRIVGAAITGVVMAPSDGKLAWYIAQSVGALTGNTDHPNFAPGGEADEQYYTLWPTNGGVMVQSTGVFTPTTVPEFTADALIGKYLNLATSYGGAETAYVITDNDATTITVSGAPANGTYYYSLS